MASIRAELRRGIRLSVEEHRRERVRPKELDARQAEHEKELNEFRKSFQNWLDGTRRGGKGHQASPYQVLLEEPVRRLVRLPPVPIEQEFVNFVRKDQLFHRHFALP